MRFSISVTESERLRHIIEMELRMFNLTRSVEFTYAKHRGDSRKRDLTLLQLSRIEKYTVKIVAVKSLFFVLANIALVNVAFCFRKVTF